jgi:hypothetical protein
VPKSLPKTLPGGNQPHCDHCHDRLAKFRLQDLSPACSYWCAECFEAVYPTLAKLVREYNKPLAKLVRMPGAR